jgi:hypothetical protein
MSILPIFNAQVTYDYETAGSKAVVSASSASHDMALRALENIVRKDVATFLAAVTTTAVVPSSVRALMILYQIQSLLFNTCLPCPRVQLANIVISVNNVIDSSHQAPFFPMGTLATLPLLTTDITKLCFTKTGCAPDQ